MANKKFDDFFLSQLVINSKIEFISGKYFYNQNEILHIDKYLGRIYFNATGKFINDRDLKFMKTNIINNPLAEEKEKWYDSDIVLKAKEKIKEGYKPDKIAFPLDEKQLLIINILLFHPEQEIFFIATGIGGSGKSTFLNIIKQLFDNDVSSVPLSLLGDGFVRAEALKHRLIASDELGTGEVDLPVIKTMVSKQNMIVNEKFGSVYNTLCQSALFFCCNKAPRIDITDTGMLRRIVFYKRNTKIKNPDFSLQNKKYTKDELIDIAVMSYYSKYDTNSYEWKKLFADETNEYLLTTNSVGLYYKRLNPKKRSDTFFCYSMYKEFVKEAGYKCVSIDKFEEIKAWIRNVEEEAKARKYEDITDEDLPF